MKNDKLPGELIVTTLVLVLGALPAMLDTTIVNIAVNNLAKQFGSTLEVTQWIVTAYVLALAIAVPVCGWLMRRYDSKFVIMLGLALFLAGSLLSGCAWDMSTLILFRILQGLSAGLIIPALTSMVMQLAAGEAIGRLISVVSIPIVFAPIAGPVIGGLILQYASWHWLFFINLPLGFIALALMQWKLPRFEAADKNARLDWIGILLLASVSSMSILGVIESTGEDNQFFSVILFVLASVSLLIYILYARQKKADALIPLKLFRSKHFSASFIMLFLAGFAANGPMLLLPLFFQNVRNLSVIAAALWLIPQGIGMLLSRPFAGKLTDRIGSSFVALPSIFIILAGTIPFLFFDGQTDQMIIWLTLLLRGVGLGGFTIPVMSDSYVGLRKDQIPSASVATRIIQNIGAAFGSAILAVVVSQALHGGTRLPLNTVGAYHRGFLMSLIFMVASIIPAFFLSSKIKRVSVAAQT